MFSSIVQYISIACSQMEMAMLFANCQVWVSCLRSIADWSELKPVPSITQVLALKPAPNQGSTPPIRRVTASSVVPKANQATGGFSFAQLSRVTMCWMCDKRLARGGKREQESWSCDGWTGPQRARGKRPCRMRPPWVAEYARQSGETYLHHMPTVMRSA